MNPYFSDKHVDAAIQRISGMPTDRLLDLQKRARQNGSDRLVLACDTELRLRPFAFTTDVARRFAQMATAVAGAPLREAIRHAFGTEVPAREYELRIIRLIAEQPGIAYRALASQYGKGDASLVIGHLVFDRFGCFRHLLADGDRQSDLLLHRGSSSNGVTYQLRAEAEEVFRELEII